MDTRTLDSIAVHDPREAADVFTDSVYRLRPG